MTRQLIFAPAARQEVLSIIDYISTRQPQAAERFRVAVRDVAENLTVMPYRGPSVHGAPDGPFRRVVIPGFRNYLLFYYVAADTLTVTRVLHVARDLPAALEEDGDA